MSEAFALQWIINAGNTRGNTAIKTKLTQFTLNSLFSCSAKEEWKRLTPSLSLYYDPTKTNVYKWGDKYGVYQDDINVLIIPDSVVKDAFILIFYYISPYEAYRSYTHCKIQNAKFIITPISDFEGSISPHSIIYSNKDYISYVSGTWNFDSRNHLREMLINGLLIIYINHRDAYFEGCTTIHCHDINNHKRWMYASVSHHSISLDSNFSVEDKVLKIGDYILNLDITHK